ncbi:MAG: radical SAM protein [Prolixibacteraceae bacterium]|nr:radical SAM protein [Prolixibacteraceae bacterium]
MKKHDVTIESNANFHHVAGENLFERDDAVFKEYRQKWKEWPETFHVGGFPLFIDIEVTSVCNLRCPFCATTYLGKKIKRGFITFDNVKKILDEGSENSLYGVKFNIRGEPLLHPQIHEFVRYAKEKGLVDVYFNSNAVLLTEKIAEKLIEAHLDRLSISFEGYTKDIYEKNRVGAKYEHVLANIDMIQRLKRRLGVDYPKVRIQTVMLPEIKPMFEDYKIFWSKRVDEVAYLDFKEMKKKHKAVKYPWACPQIWQRMAVWWDGTILPCNHDDEGLIALGNIETTSIKEAWHSEALKRIRDIHRQGNAHTIPACDGCYLRDSEIMKLFEKGVDI